MTDPAEGASNAPAPEAEAAAAATAPTASTSTAAAPVTAIAQATVSAGVPVDLGDKPSTVVITAIHQGNPDDDCKMVAVTYPDGTEKQHQVFHKQENAAQQLWDAIRQHFDLHFGRKVAAPVDAAQPIEHHVGTTVTLDPAA